jgi:glycosyltransferase involved in cell wall biosynthesis
MARICLVTHYFPPHVGGIEKVAWEQSKRLAKMGYEIHVLTSETSRQTGRVPTEKGIKVFHYSTNGLAERMGLPYPIPWLNSYKLFKEVIGKCDLVHAHGHPYPSSLIACKVAKKLRKPFIATQHNTFIDYDSWLNMAESLNDWIVGTIVLKNADRVVVVSKKTMEYVLKLGAKKAKTSVIYNGVDADFFHPMNKQKCRENLKLPKDKTIILTIRRLVYKNGLNTLIEAASLLMPDNPNLLLILVGTGPDKGFIQRRVEELRLSNNVKLTGFTPDRLLPQYYSAADLFVIPSSSGEGLPMVLLEAMACRLPVVSTITGGVTEIIEDAVNGALVPPKQPEALADAISKLLTLKNESQKMGETNRKTAQNNFTWDKNVKQLHEIYKELL